MKALVTTRPEAHRIVDDDGNAEPYRWQLSIDDSVALEAALDTAETVTAVGIGGDPARSCVRSALQRGADNGIHVSYDPVEAVAGEKFATVLARTVARESPDVVFVGELYTLGGPEVANFTASRLDWPCTSRVTELGVENLDVDIDVSEDELAVQRKLAIGRQEAVVVTPPAIVGVDAGYTNPSRGDLETVVAGQRASIETVDLQAVAPGESRFSMSVGAATVEDVTPNERWGRGRPPRTGTVEERIYRMLGRDSADASSAGERIDAPPDEAADRIVSFLSEQDLL